MESEVRGELEKLHHLFEFLVERIKLLIKDLENSRKEVLDFRAKLDGANCEIQVRKAERDQLRVQLISQIRALRDVQELRVHTIRERHIAEIHVLLSQRASLDAS
jgi:hypothetical protein